MSASSGLGEGRMEREALRHNKQTLGTLIGPTTDQKHAVSEVESYGKQEPRRKKTQTAEQREDTKLMIR